MRQFSAHPLELPRSMWRNRELIYASAKREIQGRYRGSTLGLFWSFVNPLLMLSVYTFVFSKIFNARWNTGSDSKTEFALVLFAALIVFNIFSECISRAPGLIISNPNYVKKVVFPLEILPVIALFSACYHAIISLLVWFVAYLLFFGLPHPSALYLPLILLPFALFILGLSWALASLGVFLRDIAQFISIVITMLMFLSPIFYPASALPEAYRKILYMNPLTPAVEMARDALYVGKAPALIPLGIYFVVASLIAWLGFAWFQKTRKGFADVL